MIRLAGTVALLATAGWVVTRLRIAVVTGPSMAPALREHDRVLVRRTRASALRRGDVALVALPEGPGMRWILKRVAALPGDPAPPALAGPDGSAGPPGLTGPDGPAGPRVPAGMLVLLGDNPQESVDSRDFGYVPAGQLFGVVVRKL